MAQRRYLGLLQKLFADIGIVLTRSDGPFQMNSLKTINEFYRRLIPINYGWTLIRIGGDKDGGYVIPDDLNGITSCLSPGCNLLSSFERQLFDEFDVPSQICDLPEYLPTTTSPGLEYIPKLLGQDTSKCITLDQWVKNAKRNESDELILQMDIEGAEFEILQHTDLSVLETFRIIVIEFHHLELLKYAHFSEKHFVPVFDKLSLAFDVVNTNANNACGYWFYGRRKFPPIVEVTFHRKDRRRSDQGTEWNSSLNRKNVPDLDPVVMPWQ